MGRATRRAGVEGGGGGTVSHLFKIVRSISANRQEDAKFFVQATQARARAEGLLPTVQQRQTEKLKRYKRPTPCAGCHPGEGQQYACENA